MSCLFRWVQHVWAAKTEFGFVFQLGTIILTGVKTVIAFQCKRAESPQNRWSRKGVVLQCVPHKIVCLHLDFY